MIHCPVDIWTIDLDAPRPKYLSEQEQIRANRFHFERDRIHWGNARSALRATLAGYLDCDPLALVFCYGPHDKPSVQGNSGLEFNLSHSRNRAMIAVTRAVPVGIDLESIREGVEIAALLRRIGETELTGSKEALFHVWTRREARTKAIGGSLMDIPSGEVRAIDISAPQGFAASVALVGQNPVPVYRPI